jgi:hypothetical protein
MKYRTDYVSNSSSACYIIGFKTQYHYNRFVNAVSNGWGKKGKEFIKRLLDINRLENTIDLPWWKKENIKISDEEIKLAKEYPIVSFSTYGTEAEDYSFWREIILDTLYKFKGAKLLYDEDLP